MFLNVGHPVSVENKVYEGITLRHAQESLDRREHEHGRDGDREDLDTVAAHPEHKCLHGKLLSWSECHVPRFLSNCN